MLPLVGLGIISYSVTFECLFLLIDDQAEIMTHLTSSAPLKSMGIICLHGGLSIDGIER